MVQAQGLPNAEWEGAMGRAELTFGGSSEWDVVSMGRESRAQLTEQRPLLGTLRRERGLASLIL